MKEDKLFQVLIAQSESESLDFKVTFSNAKDDFIHDVLALYNSPIPGEKFLVYGVEDNGTIKGLTEYIKSHELNDFLAKASLSNQFSIQIQNHLTRDNKKISIVKIPENNIGPIVLKSDKYKLKKDHVYVRNGDSNTGKTETASPDIIKKIIVLAKKNRQKDIPPTYQSNAKISSKISSTLYSHQDIHHIFHQAIKDYNSWDMTREFNYNLDEDVETYFFKYNMDITITTSKHLSDFREPWAQDAPDPRAFSYFLELRYKGIKINEVIYVSTDGGRAHNVIPIQKFYQEGSKNGTYYYYYIKESLKYNLNIFLNSGEHHFYLDRTSIKEFPIFSSEEEALLTIEQDYKSGNRQLLSYSTLGGYYQLDGRKVRKYKKFPKV